MKKLLLTGGAGFIGSHIAYALINRFEKIYLIDNMRTGDVRNLSEHFEFIQEDCAKIDYSKYKELADVDSIIHFAGQSSAEISFRDPLYDFNSNLLSTIKLLEFATNNSIRSFIFASSVTVYKPGQNMPLLEKSTVDNSNSFYAISKLTSEKYISLYSSSFPSIHTTSLRLFNVYGPAQNLANPDQGMLSIYLAQAFESDKILVKGSLDRIRDFVHVYDVVDVVDRCLKCNHPSGMALNVCSGKPTEVLSLIKTISKSLEKELIINNSSSTPGDTFEHWGSNNLCESTLNKSNWVSLEDGLKMTIEAHNKSRWFDERLSYN